MRQAAMLRRFPSLRRGAAALALVPALGAGAALAQDAALPDFQTCMDIELAHFEQRLSMHAEVPLEDVAGGLWQVTDTYYCGTVGIVRCDRSDRRVACQEELEAEQDEMAEAVRAGLPDPDSVGAQDEGWAGRLYRQAHALALGSSAGPDCAGNDELMEAWCAAREANTRLRSAILAWQVGRYLGITESAVDAGWANPPPPVRPRPRPEQ